MDYTGTSSRTVKIRMSTYSHIETPTLPPHRYAGLGCCCPHPLAGRRPAQPLSPVLVHSMTLSYPQGAWNILASQAGGGNIAAAAAKAVLRSAWAQVRARARKSDVRAREDHRGFSTLLLSECHKMLLVGKMNHFSWHWIEMQRVWDFESALEPRNSGMLGHPKIFQCRGVFHYFAKYSWNSQ